MSRVQQMNMDAGAFQQMWAGLQSSNPASRIKLAAYLTDLLRSEHPLLMANRHGAFETFAQVAVITAYFCCKYDGNYRQAYQLLADWSLMKAQLMGSGRNRGKA